MTGRYFADADPRQAIHPLSQRILKLKRESNYDNDNQARFLSKIFKKIIKHYNQYYGPINFVVPIPSKPDQTVNHMALVTNHLQDLVPVEIDNELLFFNRNIRSQKDVGNHTNRFLNVQGAFNVRKNVRNAHIVLIDDIVTSGATLLEAAKTLYDNGADRVTAIAIGSSQTIVKRDRKYHYSCPCSTCEGTFKIKFNSQTNDVFFGCSNWPDCKQSDRYETVRKNLVRQNILSRKDLFNENNIEF